MFDEVQCGFGRTGDWCAWRTIVSSGADPDAVSWAKGIAGGVPLGAFWAGMRAAGAAPLCDLLGPGTHGTTYGGNPLAAAAGLAVLTEIGRADLLSNARELGAHLIRELAAMALPAIRLVRGVGLMIGIELNDLPTSFGGEGLPSIRATKALMAEGLLVIPSGERTIRLLPPLTISGEEADEALVILRKVLAEAL